MRASLLALETTISREIFSIEVNVNGKFLAMLERVSAVEYFA